MKVTPSPTPDPVPTQSADIGVRAEEKARDGKEPAWTDGLLANPHEVEDKAARVNRMFAAIAPSYDLNNRLHSLWMDQHWRNVAVKMAEVKAGDRIVDVACGTGDLAIKFAEQVWKENARQYYHDLKEGRPTTKRVPTDQVLGIDFTAEMLPIAVKKAQRLAPSGFRSDPPNRLAQAMQFIQGDAMALPLGDQSVDIVSIAFGIRNVADWGKAIGEFARVLKPGGRLVILEFSLPRNGVLRGLYNFYFRRVLPRTATWISRDKTGAYKYLPESVNTFISREAMVTRMQAAGFEGIEARALTFGVCVCYKGVKKDVMVGE
jgi:demethylmenaquinone methyltransferase/2-methoxy-6-polyprenyl-1,4-benzoquinol methylase